MKPTRRQFLATGAVAGAGSLAGCGQIRSLIPFIGGGGGVGAFTDWVPAAGEIQPGRERVSFSARNPSQINGNRTNLHPTTYRNYQSSYRTGVEWKSLDMDLSIEGGAVYTGSYNVDDVTSELTTATGPDDQGKYTQEDSEGNYEIYIPSNADGAESARNAYAVSGNAIIQSQPTGSQVNDNFSSAVANAKSIIAIGEDGEGRAVEDDDTFSTLADELGGTIVQGSTRPEAVGSDAASARQGNFEGLVAAGTSISINGGNSEVKQVFVFDSEGDVDTEDLEEYVEANDTGGGTWDYTRNVSVSQSGTAGIITGQRDTYDLGR
jgi:hypothetical protein